MARIKYSGLVSEVSGSVGGSTFQKSLYGNTLRSKPSPINKRTESQVQLRHLLSQLHSLWRGLTPAQRQQWDRFISFSNQTIRRDKNVLMSGHDLFIKYNLAKLMIGDSILSVPSFQTMPEFPGVTPSTLIGSDGVTLTVSVDDVYDEDVIFCLLKLSSPRPPSRQFTPGGLRNIELSYDGTGAFSISTAYSDIFGFIPAAGLTLNYSFQWFSRVAPLFAAPMVGSCVIVEV